MPFSVTTNAEMSTALRPDAYYPEIQTNGAVSTDEEDNTSSTSMEDISKPAPPSVLKAARHTNGFTARTKKTVRLAKHEEGLEAAAKA